MMTLLGYLKPWLAGMMSLCIAAAFSIHSATADAPARASISGRFLNTMKYRVRVGLSRLDTSCQTPIRHAYTRVDGRFSFGGLRDGEYLIYGETGTLDDCAKHPGPCHLRRYGVAVHLRNQKRRRLKLSFPGGQTISGRVTDTSGRPLLCGVIATYLPPSIKRKEKDREYLRLASIEEENQHKALVETSKNGTFTIDNLRGGRYLLVVSCAGYDKGEARVQTGGKAPWIRLKPSQ